MEQSWELQRSSKIVVAKGPIGDFCSVKQYFQVLFLGVFVLCCLDVTM